MKIALIPALFALSWELVPSSVIVFVPPFKSMRCSTESKQQQQKYVLFLTEGGS